MPARRSHIPGAVPALITFVQWLIDPVLTVVTLLILMHYFYVPLDGMHEALAIIAFLLAAHVFRDADLVESWSHGGIRAHSANLLMSWLEFVVILLAVGYATGYLWLFNEDLLILWAVTTPPILVVGHAITRWLLLRTLESEDHVRNVVMVGVNDLSRHIAREAVNNRDLGMSFKGYFEDRSAERVAPVEHGPILGRFDDLAEYAKSHRVDIIYIALPMVHAQRLVKLLDDVRDSTASIYFVPDIFMFDLIQSRIDQVGGVPVLAICETPFYGINGLIKRLSDVVLSGLILALISPLLLLIALAVKLTSPGPVIFRQRRYGLDGQEIHVYKFRTMRVLEDGGEIQQATKNDPRVTPVGRLLRKLSLDELPQFVNVLQGRMSIVGPRPHAVSHNEQYRKLIKDYMIRHKVKPGITGWAQINGLRGETENLDKMKQRIEYDLDYLRNWSLGLDLKIILKTIWVVFRDRNAY